MITHSNQKTTNTFVETLEPLVLMSASLWGTDMNDWIAGTAADDSISALGGDDEIYAPQGRNFIDGGSGIDTLIVYEGAQSDFDVEVQRNGSVLISGTGLDGAKMSNTLVNVERIAFTDGIVQMAGLERPSFAPTANTDHYVIENSPVLLGNVLQNDFDLDGEQLTAVVTKQPAFGFVKMNANGGFAYLRIGDLQADDAFEYTVTDSSGASSVQQVVIAGSQADAVSQPTTPSVVISPPSIVEITNPETNEPGQNLNPFSVDDAFDVIRGETLFGNVTLNDGDADGPAYELTFELVEDAKHGNLNFYSDGSFDYWASETGESEDSFRYSVSDKDGGISYATVELGLPAPISLPPTNVIVVNEVGPAEVSGSGTETATATATATAVEPNTATATDTNTQAATNSIKTRPTIASASTTGQSNGSLVTSPDPLLASTLNITEYSTAQSGIVTVDGAGNYNYQANEGFSGIDYFHYSVRDGKATDWVTAVVHVGADTQEVVQGRQFINAVPGVATPIVVDLNNDNQITVTGETTARDKSNISSVGATVQFDIEGDGIVDSVEWIDGTGDGLLVDTSKINGTSIDGKALFGDEGGLYENGYQKLAQLDIDGNSLLEGAELSNLALWIDDGDGALEAGELSELDRFGIFSISTRMTLENGLMRSSAFTDADLRLLTEDVWFAKGEAVESVSTEDNTAPDADPDVYSGQKNSTIAGNVLSNDHDFDGDTLSLLRHTQPIHGTITIGNDGAFSYVPDADFVGVDYFQYEISDGRGGTDTAVAMLTVQGDASVIGQASGNTISGRIWEDADSNGLQGSDETGRGTSVFVSLVSGDGVVLESVHTNSRGMYSFDGLADGSYKIRLAASSLPGFRSTPATITLGNVNSNFFDAIDSDVSQVTGESGVINFAGGETAPKTATIDAGYYYAN